MCIKTNSRNIFSNHNKVSLSIDTNNTPQFNRKTFDFSNLISNSTKNSSSK